MTLRDFAHRRSSSAAAREYGLGGDRAPTRCGAPREGRHHLAEQLAAERERELGKSGITGADLAQFRAGTELRVLTPGSSAGEPVHILSSLERRSSGWDVDPEACRAAISAAISLVRRLLGKDPDPAKSREHVLRAVLAERPSKPDKPPSSARCWTKCSPHLSSASAPSTSATLSRSRSASHWRRR